MDASQGGGEKLMQQRLMPYKSVYYTWLPTQCTADGFVESLASTLVDSPVNLNPHEVEAALFAYANPLSRGVILGDEVGLGKTKESDRLPAVRAEGLMDRPSYSP